METQWLLLKQAKALPCIWHGMRLQTRALVILLLTSPRVRHGEKRRQEVRLRHPVCCWPCLTNEVTHVAQD